MDLVCVGNQALEFVQNASEATGDGCEKRICIGGFWTSEFACSWKAM